MPDKDHLHRIKQELRAAGASSYGLIKFASKYLPNIIHPDEHVEAATYGRYREDGGLLRLAEGMLVATDRRIIFLDHKPGYTSTDEIMYNMVSGVKQTSAGLFTAVTLRTRLGDYTIRFANRKSSDRFVHFIETRRIESPPITAPSSETAAAALSDQRAVKFLKDHDIGVLSTVDRSGNPLGSAVYYMVEQQCIYVLTKSGTKKARNILAHPAIALTVFEEDNAQTLQLQGYAEAETDQKIKNRVLAHIVKTRSYGDDILLPPVTTLYDKGTFLVVRITPTLVMFSDYKVRGE